VYREHGQSISEKNSGSQRKKTKVIQEKAWQESKRLLNSGKVNLTPYKTLEMGQYRIERIINNSFFISKQAWRHGHRQLALSVAAKLAGRPATIKKTAGKLRRKVMT
jgi:3-methyladenine DNA glycosylase Mpg